MPYTSFRKSNSLDTIDLSSENSEEENIITSNTVKKQIWKFLCWCF